MSTMRAVGEEQPLPRAAVVDVVSDPAPDFLRDHLPAAAALLRMAIVGGMELTVPTALHLIVDVCQEVVTSEVQVALLDDRSGAVPRLQVARHIAPAALEESGDNPLHGWVQRWSRPLLIERGYGAALDALLDRVQAEHALAVPLFIQHGVAGSLQLFRGRRGFTAAEAQLLWTLSLLAENQLARIYVTMQLTRMAFTDYLTGLKTRGYFEQSLEQETQRTLRRARRCALLLLDFDDFKHVNDVHGHAAGDSVLRQVAQVLTRDMREIDTVARLGGDEFSILLPETDAAGSRFVATRLRDNIGRTAFRVPETNASVCLSASVGVAICPDDATSATGLLRAADLALYRAKQQGKNRLHGGELRRTS